MDWIQIGAMAGPTWNCRPSHSDRPTFESRATGKARSRRRAYLAELPSLIEEIDAGRLEVTARPVPLADVESVWNVPDAPGVRVVLVP